MTLGEGARRYEGQVGGPKELVVPGKPANLFEIAEAQSDQPFIHLFTTDAQIGSLYQRGAEGSVEVARRDTQQALHVIRGGGSLSFGDPDNRVAVNKGGILVIPRNIRVAFDNPTEDFLVYGITTNPVLDYEGKGKARPSGTILMRNIYELERTEQPQEFMSTVVASGGNQHSEVNEIEIFFPELAATERAAIDGSQAARYLLYDKTTTLDRHTHPLAQHNLFVTEGVATVENEGEQFNLTSGDMIIVTPNARHQLGAIQRSRVVVVNSPGIPPTHPNYHRAA